MNLTKLSPENLHLTTERLSLKPMDTADWTNFKRLQTEPNILTYISEPLDEDAIEDKFNRSVTCWQHPENWHTLMAFEKETNLFIGCFAFRISNAQSHRAEIGYLAVNDMQGKGYITEAGNAVINFLFTQLNVKKVEAFCSTENANSISVLQRLNLKQEGILLSEHLVGERWQNSYVYGLVNS